MSNAVVTSMTFDLRQLLEENAGEGPALHERFMNRDKVRMLRAISFDRRYVRGDGCYLFDREGRRYLDFLAGFGVFALGRNHPVVRSALRDALDLELPSLVQMDSPPLAGLLARALVERAPEGLERVLFTNAGAETVESALKFARAATGRSRIVYCDHAFHGLTLGALSVNGGAEFRRGFGPLLPGCASVPFGDAAALERELRRGDVAAFIVEPIQGKGVNLAPEDYWLQAGEFCRRYGTLLIADEVQTGLGRTGRLLALEHWGIRPDIVTLSKALSGGYIPVGALLCSSRILERVYGSMDRAEVHSSTFEQNALAMVAGLATLSVIEDEHLVARAESTGEALMGRLQPLVERYELFHSVRGKGLMVGLVFGEPSSRRLRAEFRALEFVRTGLFAQLVVGPLFTRHRVLTQVAADKMNVVKILPPLVCGEEEIDWFVGALDDVLRAVHEHPASALGLGLRLAKGALSRAG